MERIEQRLETSLKALATLKEALSFPKDPITRDASIQRFEYTYEVVWKTAQHYLREFEGITPGSPKSIIRASLKTGIVSEEDARTSLQMVDDRNQTVHTYNERLANKIYSRLGDYVEVLDRLITELQQRTSQ